MNRFWILIGLLFLPFAATYGAWTYMNAVYDFALSLSNSEFFAIAATFVWGLLAYAGGAWLFIEHGDRIAGTFKRAWFGQ